MNDDKKMAIILGWGEKATSNYINLCIGEEPDVEIEGLDSVEERPDEEVLIDASRYGIGLYEITQDGIQAQNPENVYIVNLPGQIRSVTAYVFFAKFKVDKQEFVKFTIHGRGYIQHSVYEVREDKLGYLQDLSKFPAYSGLVVDDAGLQYPFGTSPEGKPLVEECLVIRLDNALSSERRYGRSDYTPSVVSLIEALELAFSRREEVLAKFARPIFMAPESAYNHYNHAKQVWEIRTDEPLMVEPGSVEAKYLTWQAELGAVENAIKDKMDQLLQMMDLVKQEELGQATSGTALAFRLLPTRSRVRKFATSLKKAIPKVLSLKSKLDVALKAPEAVAFEPSAVSVQMQDGIPSDPKETNQWVSMAYIAGYMSLEAAVAKGQDLEPGSEALLAEVERIKTEKAMNPVMPPAQF